jgi:predicted dithiol-disulfide oxidoreductase (DUF899 family)
MNKSKTVENDRKGEQPAWRTPPIVPMEVWEAARQQMLVKEKTLTRARDALAAERRRMPWMVVEKAYEFEGFSPGPSEAARHLKTTSHQQQGEGRHPLPW